MNLSPCFILSVKINSKWTTDLNIKPRTMKFYKRTLKKISLLLELGKNYLDMIPKTSPLKKKMRNLTVKTSFCSLKDTVKILKR